MVETKAKRPTESLAADHVEVIAQLEKLRDAGSKLSSASGAEFEAGKRDVGEVATFLKGELELHLRKEEEALFPSLEAIIGAGGGPTAVMRFEHDDLRAKNGELQSLVADFGDAEKTKANVRQLQGTISFIYNLLTQHIHKEDFILFPMADGHLDAKSMEAVAAKMQELDASR